jgi:hypothetical protein
MQEGMPESERHDLQNQEDRALITRVPTGSQGLEPPARGEPSGAVKGPSIEEGEPGDCAPVALPLISALTGQPYEVPFA